MDLWPGDGVQAEGLIHGFEPRKIGKQKEERREAVDGCAGKPGRAMSAPLKNTMHNYPRRHHAICRHRRDPEQDEAQRRHGGGYVTERAMQGT